MKKELLVIGAGNIGRGVIGGLFFESGYHLYIYDIMEERMKQLKEQGTYLIERVGANNAIFNIPGMTVSNVVCNTMPPFFTFPIVIGVLMFTV